MLNEKSRKIISLLLVTLLLASCGSTVETDDVVTSENTPVETEPETEPSEYVSPDEDYNGATFTVAAVDFSGSASVLNYCEAFSDLTGDVLHDALYERNLAVENDLNISLETFSLTSLAAAPKEFQTPILAGEALIDYCLMNGDGLGSCLTAGVLVNLYDISTLDTSHSWWDQKSVEAFTLGNSLYAMTGDLSLYTGYAPITWFFNKDVITAYNLEDPYTLVTEGNWTIDKSIEMAYAVANDTNGNGTIDYEEDTFGICLEGATLTHVVYAADIPFTAKDNDGFPCIALNQEKAVTVVEKFKTFFNDKNVSLVSEHVLQTGYSNPYGEVFMPALQEGRTLFYSNQLLTAIQLRDMDMDFGVLPIPKYDETQENYCSPVSYWWSTYVVVPVTNTKLEMTGNVMDSVGYFSQKLVTPAYIEKSIQGKSFRDEESSAMLDIILKSRVYEVAAIYNWGNIQTMFRTINLENKEFASMYASVQNAAETALEKTIEAIKALG